MEDIKTDAFLDTCIAANGKIEKDTNKH